MRAFRNANPEVAILQTHRKTGKRNLVTKAIGFDWSSSKGGVLLFSFMATARNFMRDIPKALKSQYHFEPVWLTPYLRLVKFPKAGDFKVASHAMSFEHNTSVYGLYSAEFYQCSKSLWFDHEHGTQGNRPYRTFNTAKQAAAYLVGRFGAKTTEIVELREGFVMVDPKPRTPSKPYVPSSDKPALPVGTILQHSIGSGHDSFYQVIKAGPRMVTAKRLNYEIVARNLRAQSMDIRPIKDSFDAGSKYDVTTVKLRVSEEGQIGPIKRLTWWSVWSGATQNQYSN